MKPVLRLSIVAALIAGGTAVAHAQSGADAAGSSSATAGARVESNAGVNRSGDVEAIRARGARTSAKVRAAAEKKLDAVRRQVDASSSDDGAVAARLGAEFHLDAATLEQERTTYGAGWGELMIAHTALANATTGVTLDQLFAMRADGDGWGQIAAGLGMNLGDVVSATRAEGRVASGLSKPDGKVAVVHGAQANADLHGAMGVGHAGAKVGAGAGLGVAAPGVRIGH